MELSPLVCPNCGKTGPTRPQMVGRNVTCPRCRALFAVPMPAAEPEPEPFVFPTVREKLFPLWESMNDPVLARFLRGLVPLGARATLIGALASLGGWVYSQPPYLLGFAAAGWAWRQRNRLNFGNLFGSARFEGLAALEKARMVGRDGLLLGRYQESDYRRSRSLLRLFTRPFSESDAVSRQFLTALSGQRLNFSRGAKGPLLCVPRGDYCHLATIAPTGAGKGTNTVIPNLLNYSHSAFVVDPKGELYRETAAYRKALGQNIVVIDPCGITGAESATLNPIDTVHPRSKTVVEDARTVAEALVVKTAQDHDPHWNEHAVTILTAAILLVVCHGSPEERTLNHVRQILSSREALDTAVGVMRESDAIGGMLARYGGQIAAIPENEKGSVLSTVNRHSNFADSELVAASLASTSFDLRAVARRPTTVYLVLPAQYFAALSRLMRLWVNTLLLVIKQAGASEEHEVLFILDEFAQLGEFKPVEEAITLLRGFGLRCWLILQSISQLEACYGPARAKVILANCQTLQLFGVSDYDTAEFISKHMGDTTIATPNQQGGTSSTSGSGPNSGSSGSNRGWSFGAAGRKLCQPEEILRMPDSLFVLHAGRNPILGRKIAYYADPEFVGEASTPPPLSRVSALLCALGLLAGLYVAKERLSWPQRPFGPFLAETAPGEPQTLLTAPPARGKGKPKAPPRPPVEAVTTCPHCKKYRGTVPPDYSGEELECPQCGLTFTVNLSRGT